VNAKDVNNKFWEKEAEKLAWFKRWDKTLVWNKPVAQWFKDGLINASYACVDIHAKSWKKNKIAILWEDENHNTSVLTYESLYNLINEYAFTLQKHGVKKGDVVVLYLPMIPQSVAIMLAVARLGAIHSVVFSGFSSQALRSRINDAKAKFIVTADFVLRRGKFIPLKNSVDDAISNESTAVTKVFIIKRTNKELEINQKIDVILDGKNTSNTTIVEPVPVESTHPLFMLYTSGTTGTPKGLIHSTGGYLTYVKSTMKWAFDINDEDIYWCTADIGWITGHSYVVYGPLLHGATIVMYEGAPDFPDPGKWWRIIEKYKVSIFYTAPTAIRLLMKYGNEWPKKYNLNSLKVLGTVGEVINPEAWKWYNNKIGNNSCPIIDTWWQTETGGFMISPTVNLKREKLKPGSATFPLPEISADIVDKSGKSVEDGVKGYLVIKKPWPGMATGIYNNQERFEKTYWSKLQDAYYSGDYAVKDKDGYFWLLGRADEILNIAGHRIGTAEIENAVVKCSSISEAAAIGVKDEIQGESVEIFAVPKTGTFVNDKLKNKITNMIQQEIGKFVIPRKIHVVEKLPKTRSGKIMRRLLKAVVEKTNIGDTSTLDDKEVFRKIKSECNTNL
jgi:acetyl-CoA synthetase